MKKDLLKAVRTADNLERAWRVIQENGRTSKSDQVKLELEQFAENAPARLRSLKARLGRNKFVFKAAQGIPVPKTDEHGKKTGKFRPIVLAPVENRIVQRAILNVLMEIEPLKQYIKTPYSFGAIRANRPQQKNEGKKKSRIENASAVPAAIQAVLNEINNGARYIACADIKSFFTRIPKSLVLSIIEKEVKDKKFIEFLRQAIDVELENLAELRERATDFPIEDMGVAQGNSLSPLLGNIVLASFDNVMNEGDCRCVRYIDDFIILAPTQKAANARLRKAISLLKNIGMELSAEKSSKGGQSIDVGFDFLGIHISPGLVRPSDKSQKKFLNSLDGVFEDGEKALLKVKNGQVLQRPQSLLGTLKRVDGMIDGWGKHYWFCNDVLLWQTLDEKIFEKVRGFLGVYKEARTKAASENHTSMLGLSELTTIPREPFSYPSIKKKVA